jgi:ELWxxDGT repeat protein
MTLLPDFRHLPTIVEPVHYNTRTWTMNRFPSFGVLTVVLALILYACNIGGGGTPDDGSEQSAFSGGDLPGLGLSVQPQSGTFDRAGQTVNFQYFVTNSGNTLLQGLVLVDDNRKAVTCPAVNTVGDLDNDLDPGESVTCTATYTLTEADVNAGSVTSTATARIGVTISNSVDTSVPISLAKALEVTVIADPTTYNAAAQVINFTYTIRNKGTTTLGPAQFVISTDRIGTVNCGGADSAPAPEQSFTCNASYTTTDADRSASELVFNVSASGGGATSIQPVSITIRNTAVAGGPSNLTPGSTITHDVNPGEWMLQIVRCYGADFNAVKNANPQVKDPAKIWPVDKLTIPNIGSNGRIYGPPCVIYYNAVSGDTWESIAQKHNADLAVLREANLGVALGSGVRVRVPINSAGGSPTSPTVEPIRISFPTGSPSVTLSGTVTAAKGRERYVFAATQGQSLNVTLTASAGDLRLAITTSTGVVLKAQDATLTWSGTIPVTGDHFIDIVNISTADRPYQLVVALTTPVSSDFERAADINSGPADSNPAYLTVFNNLLYFGATGNAASGAELWRFDSATNTASLAKDILPGAEGSNPSHLAVFNGALYFSANADSAGMELWRYNGTDAGRLSDINSGAAHANPSYLKVFNDRLYFSATSSDGTGTELWMTDGNTVTRAFDVYEGDGSSNPAYLAEYNGALYFSAVSNDGAGVELWKFDGTTATRVTDLYEGVGNTSPAHMTVFNGLLYFSANANDGKGIELYKFDGTTASLAADIHPSGDSAPSNMIVFEGALYFSAAGSDGTGFELWKFDGTTATRVSDLNTGGGSFPAYPEIYNNSVYFQADGGDGAGKELWRYRP